MQGLALDSTLATFGINGRCLSKPIYTNLGQGKPSFEGVEPFAIAACPTADYIAIATDFDNNNVLLVYPYSSAQGSLGQPSVYTDNLTNFGSFSFDKTGNYIVACARIALPYRGGVYALISFLAA